MRNRFFEIKPYTGLPCEAEVFSIKGKPAELRDFGEYEYGDPQECSDEDILRWGCYETYFNTVPYEQNEEIAKKYDLSKEEYTELCAELELKFAIGTCGWCV